MKVTTAVACYTMARREPRSSARGAFRLARALVCLCAILTGSASAQDTTRTDSARAATDSILERLQRAEEAIALLRDQLAAEAATAVQSASRVRLELFGRVLMNAFSNSAPVNNSDVPLFVLPTGERGASASVRQSSLGVAIDVSDVLGGTFAGDVHMDFFGGQQPSTGGRHFPLLRIRTARAFLRWNRGEVLVGQEVPLIAGLNPESVASFGTPGFVAAGNLWLWLPQVRGTLELGTPLQLAIQGAVLAPTTGDPANLFDTGVDPAEQTRRPYLQGRVRAAWGSDIARGQIGVGVHRGWFRRADGVRLTSSGVAMDATIPIGTMVELRAEAYDGKGLRGLGGAGIGQLVTTDGNPVEDRGGWAQLNVRPSARFELGGGCGVGDPDDAALPAGRLRNLSCEGHVITHPGGPVVAGLEFRRLRTRYPTETITNNHVNLAMGFEF
jgi:hypothetical protein